MCRRVRKQMFTWDTGASAWNMTPAEDRRFAYDGRHVVETLTPRPEPPHDGMVAPFGRVGSADVTKTRRRPRRGIPSAQRTLRGCIRTGFRDAHGRGYLDTGIYRRRGWAKLALAADALDAGGQVRFYIDDPLVGISQRTAGETLRYVRLGVDFKSYDNFWHDGVRVLSARPCAAPPQDADRDGDVDVTDLAVFQGCFNGPTRPWPASSSDPGPCACLDQDGDADADLSDFASFRGCFNGPNRPPACAG